MNVATKKPVFFGRSGFLHGFALKEAEVHPGMAPFTWWGSATRTLPAGTTETLVRLQAEDGAHSRGMLYRRGGETSAVIFNHPQGDFSSHYLTPAIVEAGYAVFGGQPRTFANDIDCIHETLLADIAAQIRYLRAIGFEKVVLCGNSGGGSLSTFYQAQAETAPPDRLTDTAAGDPYDLNALEMSAADGLILVAAHVGEGVFGLENIDPSVTDEADPLSCDPELDMYNPANGYRKPPEVSTYSPEFLARYRDAQRARCERIDAQAREIIERQRTYQKRMAEPAYGDLPLEEQLHIARLATASRYIQVPRMQANPGYTDLSISPSSRSISTLLGPDPHMANYRLRATHALTPEAWLSTWSGLSSRAAILENITKVKRPLYVINYDADAGIFPHEAEGIFRNAGSSDKQYASVDADHYGNGKGADKEAPQEEVGRLVTDWLKARFPAAS
jgi:pimeloyl-ACP methyl ester carboxylesterase